MKLERNCLLLLRFIASVAFGLIVFINTNVEAFATPPCLGTPTFTQMPPVPAVGTYQQGLAVGDFNEDGNQDIVFTNGSSLLVSIRFGDGAGGFPGATDFPDAAPWQVITADFNQDEHLDLVVLFGGVGRMRLGNGDGTFDAPVEFFTGSDFPASFDAVDINLDGKLDLMTVTFATNNITIVYGDGYGTFSSPINIPVGLGATSAAASDFNGDGLTDLASANQFADSVSIRLGAPGGTFVPAADVPAGDGSFMVRAGDFNSDGDIDLVVTNRTAGTLSTLLGDGTGAFMPLPDIPAPTEPGFAALSDLNNDGKLDVVVAPNYSNSLGVFIGDGAGGFSSLPGVLTDVNTVIVAIGDFNNDGVPDLASGNNYGYVDRIIIHLGGCSVPLDGIAPASSASPSSAPNGAGWNSTDVGVVLSAEDNVDGYGVKNITFSTSGAQTTGATVVNGPTASLLITAEGETTITYFAEDNVGNIEPAKTLIVRIDKTAPETAVIAPSGNYLFNQAVPADYACSDSVSTVISCVGTTPDGSLLDTSSIGAKSFSVAATDIAGNTTATLVTYTVSYMIPNNRDQCKNGGWQTLQRANGTLFNNQGDCVSYVNTGH